MMFCKVLKFDLVSEDENLIIEVTGAKAKSSVNPNVDKCFTDCAYMSKVKAKRKIMALTDKNLYKFFKAKSDGVLTDIEIRHFDMNRQK